MNTELNNLSTAGQIFTHAFESWKKTLLYAFFYTVIILSFSLIFLSIVLPYSSNSEYYSKLYDLILSKDFDNLKNLPKPQNFDMVMSISSLLISALLAPLSAGYLYIIHKLRTNQSFIFVNFFEFYKTKFVSIFLYCIIMSIVSAIGTYMCILPGLYIKLISFLAFPILVFGNNGIIKSFSLATKMTNSEFGTCLGVAILSVLFSFSGFLLCGIGVLLTLPFTLCASYSLFSALSNKSDLDIL